MKNQKCIKHQLGLEQKSLKENLIKLDEMIDSHNLLMAGIIDSDIRLIQEKIRCIGWVLSDMKAYEIDKFGE